MAKQRYTTEEIIHKLRETDVLGRQGRTLSGVVTLTRWPANTLIVV